MKVLAVGAHPDDLEILCAGTLARCVARGDTVTAAHIALGDAGTFTHSAEEISQIRAEEARAAAGVLGVGYQRLAIPVRDGRVNAADEHQREAMVELVRQARPDLVITHAPHDYMPDHNEASRLVFGATFSASLPNYATTSLPNYATTSPAHATVPALYYMDTLAGLGFTPTEYVDITDTIDLKLSAFQAHASQLTWLKDHDEVDMLEQITAVARFRGLQCQVRYAEGFTPCQTWLRTVPGRLLP
jgi:LmbE family N-acetylglucosaminyl deacetylase